MDRGPSLPDLESERGKGLADIKGRDPMDRRIEVEKKARYAQALREQIDANGTSKAFGSTPRDSEFSCVGSPGLPSGRNRSGSASRKYTEIARHTELPDPLGQFAMVGAASLATDSSEFLRHDRSDSADHENFGRSYRANGSLPEKTAQPGEFGKMGRTYSASGTPSERMAPPIMPSGQDANTMTAEKLGRVQEIMRQRLQSLQEEQQRQWQRVQVVVQEQMQSANDVAEQVVQRQLAQLRDAYAMELRAAADGTQSLRRDCESHGRRADMLAEELGALRTIVTRIEAEGHSQAGRLSEHGRNIEELTKSHRECHHFREETRREQREQDEAIAKLNIEQGNTSRKLSELTEQCKEVESLKFAQKDLSRHILECQKVQADSRRDAEESARKSREECNELRRQIADLKAGLDRLREDLSKIASPGVVENLNIVSKEPAASPRKEHSPPRLRERSPPRLKEQSPPCVKLVVSEQAFAVLRNGDEELYELPALRNVIGRSPTCDAVISGSQAISNRHISVNFDASGNADIKDLGSRNGSFLNERRVPQDAGYVLKSGDAIQLGVDGPTYIFEYGPAYFARWPRNMERVAEDRRDRRDSTPSRSQVHGQPPRSSWRS